MGPAQPWPKLGHAGSSLPMRSRAWWCIPWYAEFCRPLTDHVKIQCLGEMATLIPSAGAAPHFVSRFLDPAVGFTVGWNCECVAQNDTDSHTDWFESTTAVASELSAIALLVHYWTPINAAVWITIFFLPMIAVNLLMVRAYGNAEIVMSSIKVITFVG